MCELSIAIVTMDRSVLLNDALNSCILCELPEEVEFIIVDNSKNGATKEVIDTFFTFHKCKVKYIRNFENKGCGYSRNQCIDAAEGKIVYFLDDDEYINSGQRDFFKRCLKMFDDDQEIGSISTDIYDNITNSFRRQIVSSEYDNEIYLFSFGSVFLRKSAISVPTCMNIMYGYEELYPSVTIISNGYKNVYVKGLIITHNPPLNKWDGKSSNSIDILIKECASPYSIKKVIYPKILHPISFVFYKIRQFNHLHSIANANKRCQYLVEKQISENRNFKRFSLSLLLKLISKFGWRIL